MKTQIYIYVYSLLFALCIPLVSKATPFTHPGGLHTMADLERMKTKVAAKKSPWINGWNLLIQDPLAQHTYTASPRTNIGGSGNRQQASKDSHAAYLNTLRWYITGDTSYAECAVNICNAWANTVNEVASGELFQLPVNNFIQAAELLRIYPGWKAEDFEKFKTMALTYFYPACHSFIGNCYYTSSWDTPAAASILGIGVLCDDNDKFQEGVNYFKTGAGNGSIMHAICQESGQVAEMGRDQPHASIGLAALAEMCQTAWNQGIDLYSYADNRLLAGFEYYCTYNLNHSVDWIPYNNCANDNWCYVATNAAYRIRNSPVYEMIYNHYSVLQAIDAPAVKAMANLARLEEGDSDFFGYGTLTYTRDANASPYPPYPAPAAPTQGEATPGISRIHLKWTAPKGDVAQGYTLSRSTNSNSGFVTIASWTNNTATEYTDLAVVNGTTYYYTVSATNQSGTGQRSSAFSATPVPGSPQLPIGWAGKDIGSVAAAGSVAYSSAGNAPFVVGGSGSDIGGTADSYGYAYSCVTGDFTLTARISDVSWSEGSTKMGIVMRETLTPNSKMLTVNLGETGGRLARFGARTTQGGNTNWIDGNKFTWVPVWFRMSRVGNKFTAFQSSDGVSWFEIGSHHVTMSSSYYIGLSACAGSTSGSLTTVTFDHVTTDGGGTIPESPTLFSGSAINSSRIRLTWKASAATSTYVLQRSTAETGPYVTVASNLTETSYEDSELEINTPYYYVLKSANLHGESTDSLRTSVHTNALILPPAPGKLTAKAGNLQVALAWNKTEEFTNHYLVKRSATNGGPYTEIANPVDPQYTDPLVDNDSTYYYVVSSVNSLGESPSSLQVKALPQIGQYAYWPFDETEGSIASDRWNSRKGTLTAGADWKEARFNNGLYLDGTENGYATLPAGLTNSLNNFTIALWVKLDAVETWSRLFDFGVDESKYLFITPKNGANGCVRYAITTNKGAAEQQINTSTTMSAGVWTHIAMTLSGETGILYVNGNEAGRNSSMTLRPSDLGNTTKNHIGKSQYADPYLKGLVDDFRMYAQALTPTQIRQLKNIRHQTIHFEPFGVKTVGEDDFVPPATSSSGLPLAFGSSNSRVATLVHGKIHIKSTGSTNITASQAGNMEYVPALPVVMPLEVQVASGVEGINAIPTVLYTNPSSDRLQIQIDEPLLNASIQVYQTNGTLLFVKEIVAKENELDISSLSEGVYYLRIENGGNHTVYKFIKR